MLAGAEARPAPGKALAAIGPAPGLFFGGAPVFPTAAGVHLDPRLIVPAEIIAAETRLAK